MMSVIGLGGCAWMGETPPDAATYPVSKVEISRDLDLPTGDWPAENWWEVFADAQLNLLMKRALQDAPSLAVAEARIKSSQAAVDAVDASRGVSIGLSAMLYREHISGEGFRQSYARYYPAVGATGPWYTQGTVGLKGAYAIDLWGRERALLEAAIGRHRAHEAEAAEVKRALSARIASVYFDLQSTHSQLDLLTEAQNIRHESLQAHSARFRRGLEPQLLVEKARAQKAETAQLPLPAIATGVPGELGFDLLSRRPDLQALRFYVEASIGQVEAAEAAFYPSLNLQMFFGYDAIHLEDLLRTSSREINLIPGLYLPIFDSGRLNAELSIAKTAKNVLVAQYNQAIIDTVRQVAQSGVELESASRQLVLQEQRVSAAELSSAGAKAYTITGLSDGISALEATLPLLAEKSRLVELRLSQMRARIALTEALGGGYESRRLAMERRNER